MHIDAPTLTQLLGTVGTILGLIYADQRAKRKAKQDATDHSDDFQVKMGQIATDAAAEQFKQLRDQINGLQADKDELERQYTEQIALKEEENRNLRAENTRLKNRVQKLEHDLEEK